MGKVEQVGHEGFRPARRKQRDLPSGRAWLCSGICSLAKAEFDASVAELETSSEESRKEEPSRAWVMAAGLWTLDVHRGRGRETRTLTSLLPLVWFILKFIQ